MGLLTGGARSLTGPAAAAISAAGLGPLAPAAAAAGGALAPLRVRPCAAPGEGGGAAPRPPSGGPNFSCQWERRFL